MANLDFSSFQAFLNSLKIGPFVEYEAFILLLTLIVVAVIVIVVLIVNGVKSIKEQNDKIEDKKEKEFFAEYGISPEEIRLNQKIANLRVVKKKTPTVKSKVLFTNEDNSNKFKSEDIDGSRIPQENILSNVVAENINVDNTGVDSLDNTAPQVETTDIAAGLVNNNTATEDLFAKKEDVSTQAIDLGEPLPTTSSPVDEMEAAFGVTPNESPIVEPVLESAPISEPVPEPAPEPVLETPAEPIAEPAPAEQSAPETPSETEPVEDSEPEGPTKVKFLKKKGESWLKYDGEYVGYYYDPVDAYYYKGKATPNIQSRIDEFKAFYASKSAENAEKINPKEEQPASVEIGTPKSQRPERAVPQAPDEAATQGLYVINHIGEEYFFTLYAPTGEEIYESGNFNTPEYAMQALKLYRKHLDTGVPAIVKTKGQFCWILKAKGIKYTGIHYAEQDQASKALENMQQFGHTDIIREE